MSYVLTMAVRFYSWTPAIIKNCPPKAGTQHIIPSLRVQQKVGTRGSIEFFIALPINTSYNNTR